MIQKHSVDTILFNKFADHPAHIIAPLSITGIHVSEIRFGQPVAVHIHRPSLGSVKDINNLKLFEFIIDFMSIGQSQYICVHHYFIAELMRSINQQSEFICTAALRTRIIIRRLRVNTIFSKARQIK
ncbi:MAG: hypothetical protein JW995_03065 [Melioribacteraceae bacterium]|nr:hypothetical protein [Melioribacteraceae bacterium]